MTCNLSTSNKTNYSVKFDYLRVFAMTGVLAVHLSQKFPMPGMIKSVMGMGVYCVQIFFVISAYLGCSYFFKANARTCNYYKKRALRILPTYYAAIVAAMLYIEFFTKGYNDDVFHLGWLRYFLGLNTLLPSDDFWQWNNAFGFWTMTNFIFFYAIIPFLVKFAYTFRRCFILFLIFFAIAGISRRIDDCFSLNEHFDDLKQLIEWSPLVQMQHFAIGLLVFFANKENKKSITCIILIALAMLPIQYCNPPLLFSILTGLFIMIVENSHVAIQGSKQAFLTLISKYSFHIYLTHLLALEIGKRITASICEPNTLIFYIIFFISSVLITFILCLFLEAAQKLATKTFSMRQKINNKLDYTA